MRRTGFQRQHKSGQERSFGLWDWRPVRWREAMHDYFIVKAGSAGCAVANRITADPAICWSRPGWKTRAGCPMPRGNAPLLGNPNRMWHNGAKRSAGRRQPEFRRGGKMPDGTGSPDGPIHVCRQAALSMNGRWIAPRHNRLPMRWRFQLAPCRDLPDGRRCRSEVTDARRRWAACDRLCHHVQPPVGQYKRVRHDDGPARRRSHPGRHSGLQLKITRKDSPQCALQFSKG